MSAHELIRTEAANHSVKRMCRILEVSRSGYYDHLTRRRRPPLPRHERLVVKVRAIHAACEGAYGARRMHRELVADGEHVGRRLVQRLMRENGIRAVQTR